MASVRVRRLCYPMTLTLTLSVLSLGLLPLPITAEFDISAIRSYFKCPECDFSLCKTPVGCELTKEPGICGCCMTCARNEGQQCGINKERCATGLVCNPPANAINGFEALLNGQGICESVNEYRPFPFPGQSVLRRPYRHRRSQLPFPPQW